MRRIVFICFTSALLFVLSMGAARAVIMLSFDPVTQQVSNGEQVDVGVRISGLGTNTPPSLGAFDLDVMFDDSLLDFISLTFGDPVLGNQLDITPPPIGPFGTVNGFAEDPDPSVGLVDFFEISLDAPSVLDTTQAGSFILATLSFNAVANGMSSLGFAQNVLSDSLGNTLIATTSSGSINIPEPTSILLMGLGLAGLGFAKRRQRLIA